MVIKLSMGGTLHFIHDGNPNLVFHVIQPLNPSKPPVTVSPGFMPPTVTVPRVTLDPYALIPFKDLAVGYYLPPWETLWGGGGEGATTALATLSTPKPQGISNLNLPRNPFILTIQGLAAMDHCTLDYITHHVGMMHGDPFSGMGPIMRVWREVTPGTTVPVSEHHLMQTSFLKNPPHPPVDQVAIATAMSNVYQGYHIKGVAPTETEVSKRRRERLKGLVEPILAAEPSLPLLEPPTTHQSDEE